MKTIGIIAEFNPFHNGHKYLIDKAKEITKAENVVVVCSGNYVQRGYPAIIDKSIRARMAIENDADVVLELPVCYSTASAELFARGAVRLLDKLGCIDYLCFGCETDSMKDFKQIVNVLLDEPDEYKNNLSEKLKSGVTYPKARCDALSEYLMNHMILDTYTVTSILNNPNNILAIEYMKAIKHFKSDMTPIAIKRIGEHYHSLSVDQAFASATAIRNKISENSYPDIEKHIPENCYQLINSENKIYLKDYDMILGEKLISQNDFTNIYGINQDLSNRINNSKSSYTDFESFINRLQSKNYTYAAISRALLHICLGIREKDINNFINNDYHLYARILGFRRRKHILSEINEKADIDIISKLSTYYNSCDQNKKRMLDISIRCDHLYRLIQMNSGRIIIPNEFERQIYIKES